MKRATRRTQTFIPDDLSCCIYSTGTFKIQVDRAAPGAYRGRDESRTAEKGIETDIRILITGGTFDKEYFEIRGQLDLNFVNEDPIYQLQAWGQLRLNQPFFAQISTPEAEYDICDRQSHTRARLGWVGEHEHPHTAPRENVEPRPYYSDHRITREGWARYLNSVSGMDRRNSRIA